MRFSLLCCTVGELVLPAFIAGLMGVQPVLWYRAYHLSLQGRMPQVPVTWASGAGIPHPTLDASAYGKSAILVPDTFASFFNWAVLFWQPYDNVIYILYHCYHLIYGTT